MPFRLKLHAIDANHLRFPSSGVPAREFRHLRIVDNNILTGKLK